MKPRIVLQAGWRLILAIALAVMPWAMPTQAFPAQSHRVASSMVMPCKHATSALASMTKHGCPDHCCPKGFCDSTACVTHCALAAIFPVMPLHPLLRSQPSLEWQTALVLNDPPDERLRPPIS